jgi:hypothetical protein
MVGASKKNARRARPIVAVLLLLLVVPVAAPSPARAEIGDGAFQIGGLGGVVIWGQRVGLKPCGWYGGSVTHRFPRMAEKLHMGFRAGWEGCIGRQEVTDNRIDMIYVNMGFSWGIRARPWLLPYAITGAGMMLGDSTPSGGETHPRTAFHGGVGVVATIGDYIFVDLTFRMIVFENFQFGGYGGQPGTVGSPLIALSAGAQAW